MDEEAVALAKGAIDKKDDAYFASHGLADLLGEAGIDSGHAAVGALARRLTTDDAYAYADPISAGLRDLAYGDVDEFARIAGGVARTMRRDSCQGPFVAALVEIGRSNPAAAAGVAARMIGLGDADYAAYVIGGAYGGTEKECGGLVEGLLSSGEPAGAAAAVRSLRVASMERGSPGAGRIKAAVRRAAAHDDAAVQQECMEALLCICGGNGDAEAESMVESLAARCRATRPVLAGRIWRDSPFDDESSLRHLEACTGYDPDRGAILSTYCALVKIGGRRPRSATKMLLRMFDRGLYDGTLAGKVLEEIGKKDAPGAIAAVIEALQEPRYDGLDGRLGRVVGRIARFGDREGAAALLFRTMDERPGAQDSCLSVMASLVLEDWRAGGGEDLAARIMSRLRAHPAGADIGAGGGQGPRRRDATPECIGMICRAREHAAAGARPLARP